MVVIFVGKLCSLLERHPVADACMDSIWYCMVLGLNLLKHISISTVCNGKSSSLPIFHSFTGCNTTSSFLAKKSPWKSFPDVIGAFLYMASHPHSSMTTDSNHFKLLERCCIVMYDKTSNLKSINEAHAKRVILSKKKQKTQDNGINSTNPKCFTTTL